MEANTRERIEGKDFVKGGVYEVYNKDNSSHGIYFYPTSYPDSMLFERNSRGTFSKILNKVSEPLKLLILYSRIYNLSVIGKYIKFDKSKIYGKQPISIVKSERSESKSDLSNFDLSHANLEGSELININFTGTNFTRAKFTRANLTGSVFTNVNLTGAKLGKSILTDLISSGINGSPDTLPKGYYLVDGCIIGSDTTIPKSLSDKYRQIKIRNGNNTEQYLVGPKVNLAGVDLSKIQRFDLDNADLTGANLSRAILTGAYLTSVNLTGADLTGADLTGADLTRVCLTSADLTGANLTGAYLDNKVSLTGIKSSLIKGIPKRLPKGYYLFDGIIIGLNIDIPKNNTFNTIKLKKKYKKITITNNKNNTKEYIIGPNVDLTNADLTGADLTGIDFTGAVLTGVDLTDVNLTGADLHGIKSGGIKGTPILPYRYKLINGYIIGPNSDLTGADLTGIDLTGADLTSVNLTDAKLIQANFTGAVLTGAVLTGAVLTGADLTGALLTRIISGKIKGKPILPDRYKLINGYIIGPNIDLTRANFTGAVLTSVDLTDVNLTGADLHGIKSGGIKGTPILPYRYKLINGYIIGPNVNLTGADLTGADLIGIDLTGAVLIYADLTDVDLTGADLTSIKSGNIKGKPILPDRYKLIKGYIIGPNSDLTGADLTGIDLTDVDLTGTDLTGAKLTYIKSGHIKGEPILPDRYKLINGYIIGPNVNLSKKVVSKIDLTYVNLSGSDLTDAVLDSNSLLSYANLKGCDLTRATLVGVDLTRANLESAKLIDTKLFEDSLSEKQKSQIIGQPKYIPKRQKNHINISKRITDGKNKINKGQMERAKIAVQNKNNKNAIQEEYNKRMEKKRKQNEEDKKESIKILFLEKEKREPTQNEINRIYENTISKNTKKENKNFSDLLDYLLDKKNQVQIARRFVIVGEIGINEGGLTRSIFEKCYKIFIERYFKEYNFNENYYVILKDLNEELFEEFKKACEFMILISKRGGVKILIQINPQLFKLLQLGKLKYYKKYFLLNNSNNSLSLKRIKEGINDKFNSNNRLNSFSLKRIQNEVNNIPGNTFNLKRIQRQYNINENENKIIESDFLKNLLENNGIFDYKHFNKVKEFYILFWKTNLDVFTNHIDYSWDNFKNRLRFKNVYGIFNSFDEFMTEENAQINTYPFIKLILDYLQESDEYRMRFTTLTCGSYTYIGPIYIQIFNKSSILDPFNAHTCFQTIDVNINLLDRYPVLYNILFCERSKQVVNNQNESGRGSNPNENGNERANNQNERRNPIVNNESGNERANNQNERRNLIVNNESGRVNNESGRVNNESERVNNESGRVNNKSCRYSIEKLDKLIRDSINQGFNIA